jgi:zinc transporter, ZIP family
VNFAHLFAYSLIPAVAMIAAGTAAAYRAPGMAMRSAVLHLAAGVVFAVVAVEFLPVLLDARAPLVTTVGFAAGTAAMLSIGSLTRWADSRSARRGEATRALPYDLLFGTGVDIVIDGLMLGIGFAAGAEAGFLLTVALAIELASLGLATASTLTNRGIGLGRTIVIVADLALLFTACAAGGGLLLEDVQGRALALILAFGSAALLFLVTEQLLTEAHEMPESPLLTATFFLGFILLLLLEML